MNRLTRFFSPLVQIRPIFFTSTAFVRTNSNVETLYKKVNELTGEKRSNRLFAVIQLGNEQRKVTTEDIICKIDEFHPTIGDRIRFEKVKHFWK